VVAVDEQAGTVEVQRFDGDIEEIELEIWRNMEIEIAEPPEDWTGPVDNVERDDTDYSATEMSGAAWNESLQEYPSAATEPWEDTVPEDERDDWGEGAPTEEFTAAERTVEGPVVSLEEEEPGEGEEQ